MTSHLTEVEEESIKELEEKVAPAVLEDYNNFIAEAGEIGELDIEEIVVERVKPLLDAHTSKLLSGVISEIDGLKFKIAKDANKESHSWYFYKGHNSALNTLKSRLTPLISKKIVVPTINPVCEHGKWPGACDKPNCPHRPLKK